MYTDLSIIIPTHNASNHLKKSINSILSQSVLPKEIIIVDFNSTDDTFEILESFNSKIIKLIKIQKKGIYHAMNIGIANSSSKWLFFLGANDKLYDNNVFENLNNLLTSNNDLILGMVENINANNNKIQIIYKNHFSKNLYWRNTLHHQGIIYNRRIFESENFNENLKVLSDYELNLKLLKLNVNISQSSLFISKSDANGLSKQFTKELYDEEKAIKKKWIPFWAYLINILMIIPIKRIIKTN